LSSNCPFAEVSVDSTTVGLAQPANFGDSSGLDLFDAGSAELTDRASPLAKNAAIADVEQVQCPGRAGGDQG
jgi:hypothetical protein